MIRCSKCGSLNRDGSRFCNECGAELQTTRIRCPVCGAVNPVGSVFCDNCHARLVPAEGMVPPEETEEEERSTETGVGMKRLSLPTRPVADEDEDARGEEDFPDWLQGLLDESPSEEISEMHEPPFADEGTEEEPASIELPDWLSGLTAEEEPPFPEPESVEETEIEEEEEIPAWLAETEAPREVPKDEEPSTEELPDWLRDLAAEEEAGRDEAAPMTETPDWLAALAAEEEQPAAEAPSRHEIPDWLAGGQREAPEPQEAPEEAVSEETSTFTAPQGEAIEPEDEEEAALPAWLAELQPAASEAEPVPSDEGIGAPVFSAQTEDVESPMEEEGELPDWLAELQPAGSEAATAPEEEDAGVPDWLREMAPSEAEPDTPTAPPEEQPAVRTPEPEAPAFEAPLGKEGEEPPAFVLEEDEEEKEEEAPALREGAAAFVEIPSDIEEAEIPAWLRDLEPAPVAPEEIAETEKPAGLEQADLPEWLRDLKPPGTGPLPDERLSEEEIAKLAEEGLVRAEIPAWLESLRPTGKTTEITRTIEVEREVEVEPEAEGPLSGLQNVLPSTALVDIPEDFEFVLRYEPPEHLLEEARLWQELLERPPSKEPIVTRKRARSRWPEGLLRVGLFLILSLAILAVIWGMVPLTLFSSPTQPGAASLEKAVERLQPGDTVTLVLEYGPAEAGEMETLVEAVFDHLLAREARIQMLTTMPVGEALIEERLAWAEGKLLADESREMKNLGYWAGGSSGVARFLAAAPEMGETDLLLVFAARSERLRWWIEQNAALDEAAQPLGVGVSAAVGPWVKPYILSKDVQGWLVGLQGAAAYWQVRGQPQTHVTFQAHTLTFAQWTVAALLLFGALVSLLFPKRKRRS
ncbi:MAG: zinc-ribbon domain-containing protein [Anaerolineae bacterium]